MCLENPLSPARQFLHLTGYTSLSQSKIKERYNWYILSEKGIKA